MKDYNLEKLKELKAMIGTRINMYSEWAETIDNIIEDEEHKQPKIDANRENDYNDPDPYAKDYVGKRGFVGGYDDPYDPYSRVYSGRF